MPPFFAMHDFARDHFGVDFNEEKVGEAPYYDRYNEFKAAWETCGALLCTQDVTFAVAPAIGHAQSSEVKPGEPPEICPVWDEYFAKLENLKDEGHGVYSGWSGN
jgi:hypothetical protein